MSWDFSTDPDFQKQLDWVAQFVREEVEPIDVLFPGSAAPYDKGNKRAMAIVRPLQAEVRKQGLWACHLPPSLGGQGLGNVSLGLLNEILGRSLWAPSVFGCQAPDSGNAEVLAHYGTPAQKAQYLQPLLDGEISSTYAMTEPQGGADPSVFTCRAEESGGGWVINGEKWFASNYPLSSFAIVMAVTDPDQPVHRGSSMFLVPDGTPGIEIVRNPGIGGEPLGHGVHSYLRFTDCEVPAENLIGERGKGFEIAQKRLGGGRLHHAMRSVGTCKRALEMMAERVNSRRTRGAPLAERQAVSHAIADSWIQLEQFRLQVLHAAWQADQNGYAVARQYIAGVKVATPKVVGEIVERALHAHGALGVSNEMPFVEMLVGGLVLGLADGPTEVHKDQVARQVLRETEGTDGLFPTGHLPTRLAAARLKYPDA